MPAPNKALLPAVAGVQSWTFRRLAGSWFRRCSRAAGGGLAGFTLLLGRSTSHRIADRAPCAALVVGTSSARP